MLAFDLAVLLVFWQRELPDWSMEDLMIAWARRLARVEG